MVTEGIVDIGKVQAAIRDNVRGACDCVECASLLYDELVKVGIIPPQSGR